MIKGTCHYLSFPISIVGADRAQYIQFWANKSIQEIEKDGSEVQSWSATPDGVVEVMMGGEPTQNVSYLLCFSVKSKPL